MNFFISYIRPLEYNTKGLSIFNLFVTLSYTQQVLTRSYNLWTQVLLLFPCCLILTVHVRRPVTKLLSINQNQTGGQKGRGGRDRTKKNKKTKKKAFVWMKQGAEQKSYWTLGIKGWMFCWQCTGYIVSTIKASTHIYQ